MLKAISSLKETPPALPGKEGAAGASSGFSGIMTSLAANKGPTGATRPTPPAQKTGQDPAARATPPGGSQDASGSTSGSGSADPSAPVTESSTPPGATSGATSGATAGATSADPAPGDTGGAKDAKANNAPPDATGMQATGLPVQGSAATPGGTTALAGSGGQATSPPALIQGTAATAAADPGRTALTAAGQGTSAPVTAQIAAQASSQTATTPAAATTGSAPGTRATAPPTALPAPLPLTGADNGAGAQGSPGGTPSGQAETGAGGAGTDGSSTASRGPGSVPEGLSLDQARLNLEAAVPGLVVQAQAGSSTEAAPAKAALSEFLNQPRPAIETPTLTGLAGSSSPTGTQVRPGSAPSGALGSTPITGQASSPANPFSLASVLAQHTPAPLPGLPGAPGSPGAGPTLDPQNLSTATALAPLATSVAPQGTAPSPAPTTAEATALALAVPGASGQVRVPAPTSAQEAPLPSNPNANLANQVEGSIKWLLKNQDQGAELQLHPESLGRVQISLKVEGTEVHARLWASDPAALPVLQDHRAALEASLKEQGLSLGSFNLQQGRQNDPSPGQAPAQTPSGTSSPFIPGTPALGQESPTTPAPSLADPHRFEVVA